MKMLRQILGPLLALLLTFGSVAEVSAPVTVAAAGVVLGLGHAQAATPAQKAVVLNGVPGWVLRASGALPSIDMDFAHNRAWVGGSGPRAPPSLLTTTRASTGYAQWADGHVSSFAANVPRITDLGLLVEQAATNLALQSQTFDNASWIKDNGGTITANAIAGPDGTLTADADIPANGTFSNATHQDNITTTSGVSYTYSIYAKNGALGLPWVELTTVSTSVCRVWFNLSTGAKGSSSGSPTSYNITALANGWYRLDVTFTTATTHADLYLSTRPSNGSSGTITGDGVTIANYLWGAQLELGTFATSYIPTTTVAVTRAADAIAFKSSAGAIISALTGSLRTQTFGLSQDSYIVSIDSTNSRFIRSSAASQMQSQFTGTALTATAGSGDRSGVMKTALGWSAAGRDLVANNGTVTSDSAVPSSLDSTGVYIGSNAGANGFADGYVQRITAWTSRLPSAQLKALTQ